MQAKLTAEMLNDIVSNLKSDNSGTRGSDKRAQGRVGLRGLLDVVPCTFNKEANKPLSVWVRDISVNGLGLMTAQRFDDGMEFIARFVREGRPPLCNRLIARSPPGSSHCSWFCIWSHSLTG